MANRDEILRELIVELISSPDILTRVKNLLRYESDLDFENPRDIPDLQTVQLLISNSTGGSGAAIVRELPTMTMADVGLDGYIDLGSLISGTERPFSITVAGQVYSFDMNDPDNPKRVYLNYTGTDSDQIEIAVVGRKNDVVQFGNEARTVDFTKQGCSIGSGSVVPFTVNDNTFYADTQEQANTIRDSYIAANGQNNANENGYCKSISVPYSINWGANPFTRGSFDVNFPYLVPETEGSNDFDGLFEKGDTLAIRFTSKLEQNPWEINSSLNCMILINDSIYLNNTYDVQQDVLDSVNIPTDTNTNKIEIKVQGLSTAENRLTRFLRAGIYNNSAGTIRIGINDNTDNKNKLLVYPGINGDLLKFNEILDGNTLTVRVYNNGSVNIYFYLEGNSFTYNGMATPGTYVDILGVPKTGDLYFYDLQGPGNYIHKQIFTKLTCFSGGQVTYVKAYVDESASNADLSNFNSEGQNRANTYGQCT